MATRTCARGSVCLRVCVFGAAVCAAGASLVRLSCTTTTCVCMCVHVCMCLCVWCAPHLRLLGEALLHGRHRGGYLRLADGHGEPRLRGVLREERLKALLPDPVELAVHNVVHADGREHARVDLRPLDLREPDPTVTKVRWVVLLCLHQAGGKPNKSNS
eukprot:4457476-Pyramimonas_sp.AAC.1